MPDPKQWLKTTGEYATIEAAREAYRLLHGPHQTDSKALAENDFKGCAFEDGTFDAGEDAYLTALWLFLEQQRREVPKDGKAPHPQPLCMMPHDDLCPYCASNVRQGSFCPHLYPSALYPISKVGGVKSKQRKLLKLALRTFKAYRRHKREILIEGCIWQNGDFAIGPEAYDIAVELYDWHTRGGTIPKCDLPRPFAKTGP